MFNVAVIRFLLQGHAIIVFHDLLSYKPNDMYGVFHHAIGLYTFLLSSHIWFMKRPRGSHYLLIARIIVLASLVK